MRQECKGSRQFNEHSVMSASMNRCGKIGVKRVLLDTGQLQVC